MSSVVALTIEVKKAPQQHEPKQVHPSSKAVGVQQRTLDTNVSQGLTGGNAVEIFPEGDADEYPGGDEYPAPEPRPDGWDIPLTLQDPE